MILGLCRAGMLGLLLVWIRAVDEPGRMIAPCFNLTRQKRVRCHATLQIPKHQIGDQPEKHSRVFLQRTFRAV